MRESRVIHDNIKFLTFTVGASFRTQLFVEMVLLSDEEIMEFPTKIVEEPEYREPGYIKIDSSSIKNKGENHWIRFTKKIKERKLLTLVSYGFTEFEGTLSEKAVVKVDGYKFSLEIKKYERDFFDFIGPESFIYVPWHEKLGRVVHLNIELEVK